MQAMGCESPVSLVQLGGGPGGPREVLGWAGCTGFSGRRQPSGGEAHTPLSDALSGDAAGTSSDLLGWATRACFPLKAC